ncbi:MAG: CDP-glucose 4,6-dehydratase [Rickettsiales bacterium]|nr:CDP-glucose 4,6-dehydratase [Rickettsiales bacterium]
MNNFSKFFSGKKIFLTGHTGFKGSWASIALKNLGAKIYGFALPPENFRGSMFESLKISETLDFSEFGDIRDSQKLKKSIQKFEPEIILHLAAQPIVLRSYKNPVNNFETNLMGLINLFEACRETSSVQTILNVTSDKCYENNEEKRDFIESDKLGGKDPYSASKACAEIISNSYRESFFNKKNIELATARAGNVIGGGDFSENRLVPDIFEAITKNQEISIRNPRAIRPWQHVLESINGYLTLIYKISQEPKKYNQAYNFGPDKEEEKIDVENLTKIFLENFNSENKISYKIEADENALYEAKFLGLDNSKAKNELGWKPKLKPYEAIKLTAEWYNFYLKNSDNPKNLRDFTDKQIIENIIS